MPVGEATLGRVFDVLGKPIDLKGDVDSPTHLPIHRAPPPFEDLTTEVEVFETGLKIIDLICPFKKGGKVGIFGGAGVGKTVIIQELIRTSPRSTPACRSSSPASASAAAKATTSSTR